MFARETIAALAALTLAGCWPRIPGQADDYLLPETSMITGGLVVVDPIGGYWADPAPTGGVSWGVLAVPHALDGVGDWGVPGSCVRNHPGPVLEGGYRGGGSGTTILRHNDAEILMAWSSSSNQWSAQIDETDWEVDTDYDLAPVEFTGLGPIEIPGFLTTPEGGFVVTGPEMGGEAMIEVSGPEALTVTWTSNGRAEWVLVRALAVGFDGNTVEVVSCLVDDTGSLTIPPELFQQGDSTDFVALQIGALRVEGGTVPLAGEEQGYVTSSTWLVQGAVDYPGGG